MGLGGMHAETRCCPKSPTRVAGTPRGRGRAHVAAFTLIAITILLVIAAATLGIAGLYFRQYFQTVSARRAAPAECRTVPTTDLPATLVDAVATCLRCRPAR